MMESAEGYSKLEVNAALNKLASGEEEGWREAARTVINAFHRKPSGRKFFWKTVVIKGDRQEEVTGYSPEHGNVSVKVSERARESDLDFELPGEERVGEWKVSNQGKGVIRFRHFKFSDLAAYISKGELPITYRLEYDEKTLAPKAVGYEEVRMGKGRLIQAGGIWFVVFHCDDGGPKERKLGKGITVNIGLNLKR